MNIKELFEDKLIKAKVAQAFGCIEKSVGSFQLTSSTFNQLNI